MSEEQRGCPRIHPEVAWLGLRHQPPVSPRNPHAAFSARAFCKVQLILRRCLSSQGKAWQALHLSITFSRLSGTNPANHIATHQAAFSTSAFCKVQLILRSGGSGVGGVERNGVPQLRLAGWVAGL